MYISPGTNKFLIHLESGGRMLRRSAGPPKVALGLPSVMDSRSTYRVTYGKPCWREKFIFTWDDAR